MDNLIKTAQKKYRDISPPRKDIPDDVSTDAGDSLMGDAEESEKHWREVDLEDPMDSQHRQKKPLSRRICEGLRWWRWLVDTALLLVILGLLLERRWSNAGSNCDQAEGLQVAGDLTGFAPKVSQQITIFGPDYDFVPKNISDFFSHNTRKKWLEIVPKGLGYVKVENPEQYNNLPVPLNQFKNETVFTTSMTHQLHCLYAIIEEYASITSVPPRPVKEGPWHLGHCFDYLRQSIMCAADTALEGQQTTFPEGVDGSDGWGAKHVCKDYSQVYKHLEDKRADNRLWI